MISECVACYESTTNCLQCKHFLCIDCQQRWKETLGTRKETFTCPVCRSKPPQCDSPFKTPIYRPLEPFLTFLLRDLCTNSPFRRDGLFLSDIAISNLSCYTFELLPHGAKVTHVNRKPRRRLLARIMKSSEDLRVGDIITHLNGVAIGTEMIEHERDNILSVMQENNATQVTNTQRLNRLFLS